MCRGEISKSQPTQATAVSCVSNTGNCSSVNMSDDSSSNQSDPICGGRQTLRVSTPSSLQSSQTLTIGRFRVTSIEKAVYRLSEKLNLSQKNLTKSSDETEVLPKRETSNSEAVLPSNVWKQKEHVSHKTDDLLFNLGLNFPDSSEKKQKKSYFGHLKQLLKWHCLIPRL